MGNREQPQPRGSGDTGERALVLVHGAGGEARLWGTVERRLRAAGVPSLALDLPGHGLAAGPGRDSVGAYADYLETALGQAGIRQYAVAGHSLGGAIALTLAVREPPGLRGIGAVSTGARLPVDPMILKGILAAFSCTVENLARFCFARGSAEELLRQAARTMAAPGPEVVHGDFAACAAYGLSDRELTGIGVPAEVVCGDLDILTPPALSEELAAKVPGARLTRIPGCGHMPLLETPEALAAALVRLWDRCFGEGPR